MSIPRSHPFRRFVVVVALAAAGTAHAQAQGAPSGSAQAATKPAAESDRQGDALLKFVVDRGLVPFEVATHGVRQARDAASDMVISALNYLGVRYRRGGNSAEEGFDCSGFVRHVVNSSLGLMLPRRSDEQAASSNVVPVPKTELQPGDLVFFNTLRSAFSHVGIYVGDGKFIHSPRTGFSVRVEDMSTDYWRKRFDGARRLLPAAAATGAVAASPTGTNPQP
jgi:cell wall-associated NlpC family hydrolase